MRNEILFLMQLLMDETDKEYPLNATQISEWLEKRYGLTYTRKAVNADISRLHEYGLQIEKKSSSCGHFIFDDKFNSLVFIKSILLHISVNGGKEEGFLCYYFNHSI